MVLNPTVTVIMPVYNGEKFLQSAIESVLNQTLPGFELLIINDGSTDESASIIKLYNDQRIRVINHEKNLGLVVSRNRGIYEAQGKYIALLDCDDVAKPSRLQEQVEFMDNNPEFGLIGTWVDIIDVNGCFTGEVWRYLEEPNQIPSELLFKNCFAQSSILMRKNALPVKPYNNEFVLAEDYDLWVRLAARSKVGNIPKSLTYYRINPNSISHKKSREMDMYINKIISYQIQNLGFNPSEQQIILHRQLASNQFLKSKEFINGAEQWLLTLMNFNNQSKVYNERYFLQVIAGRWFTLCYNSTEFGFWIWNRFRESPLSTKVGLKSKTRFWVKCLIKYSRT